MTDALRMIWRGPVAHVFGDATRHLDLEGAIRSGKTTVALHKVLTDCCTYPGIHCLICRFSDDDTRTKLRPMWEQTCLDAGVPCPWYAGGKYYHLLNRSRVYAFGLKSQSLTERYSKFRGVTLAKVYIDQAEELPFDVYEELTGRLSQVGYPQQIILTPNPPNDDHWLARRFPEDNRFAAHRYYRVSLYDNAHNLSPETIAGLEVAYPPGHAKHGPMLLGIRGLNVIGMPVYGALDPREPESAAFQRGRHVRPLDLDQQLPLYEALDFGKHHPCVVWAQYTPYAELHILGGILGQHLDLETFAPIVQQYRGQWFPNALEVQTCCDPAGSHASSQGLRDNAITVLEELGFTPRWKADSNSPVVRDAMIERIKSYLRRRSPRGEAFGIDPRRWLRISPTEVVKQAFVIDAFEAGYVWDKLMVSVGSKRMRKPLKDGWYEHGMNCVEYLEHNFGGVQPTLEQTLAHAQEVKKVESRSRRDADFDLTDLRQRGYSWASRGRPSLSRRGQF